MCFYDGKQAVNEVPWKLGEVLVGSESNHRVLMERAKKRLVVTFDNGDVHPLRSDLVHEQGLQLLVIGAALVVYEGEGVLRHGCWKVNAVKVKWKGFSE